MQTKLELYRKVTPLAQLGIWEQDEVKDELYINSVVRKILEVPDDYTPSYKQFIRYFIDDTIKDFILSTKNTEGSKTKEFQIRNALGKIIWVKIRVGTVFEESKLRSIYGTIEDVNLEVDLIKKLALQEEQFHHAFDFAPIGMALVSLNGSWIKVNPMLCTILGYSSNDLLNSSFQKISHPIDLDADLKLMQQLLDGKISRYQIDKRYIHHNGNLIWASLHVSLVRDRNNSPLYFVSQLKDITERKNMENERVNSLELISAQNSRLLNFAHIVSHNLRSHSGNIQMITDMILEEKDPTEKDHLISMLGINARNLQETLTHLNEIVEVNTAGAQSLKLMPLNEKIIELKNILFVQLQQINATVTCDIDPLLKVNFNEAYLESILLNLFTNAIKYRDDVRPLEVKVKATQENNKIIFTIEDNGKGIDLSLHGHKLFGMYKTFHGNSDARGIGLFLIKNQIESMGGTITAESEVGIKTIFKIEFKIYE